MSGFFSISRKTANPLTELKSASKKNGPAQKEANWIHEFRAPFLSKISFETANGDVEKRGAANLYSLPTKYY